MEYVNLKEIFRGHAGILGQYHSNIYFGILS